MKKCSIVLSIIITHALAATFTVTNTNDTGNASLRWALTMANNTPGNDMINFNIPGGGVQVIRPLSQLPPLFDTAGVFIDAFSQPGASPGSNPPSTCTLMVEINGANAGPAHGFWILSPNNIINGFVIDSFQQHGIRIQGIPGNGTYNNLIFANWVGMDPSGTVGRGNGWNQNRFWGGIYIEVAPDSVGFAFDNHIDCNLSSRNYAEGVGISSCPPGDVFNNNVTGNYLGTDFTGTLDRGNVHDGVYIGEAAHDNLVDFNLISGNDYEGVCIIGYPPMGWDTHDNTIYGNIIGLDIAFNPLNNTMDGVSIGQYGNFYQGGYATGNIVDSNIIAHNILNGVTVWEHPNNNFNCDHNWITQNTMYSNGGLGIDLNDDGVTPNDNNDPDTGPNEEVNFPILSSASYTSGTTTITGSIDIDTDPTQATIEVFQAQADPSGYGEGWLILGTATPDASGNWQFVTNALIIGDVVTATTTDMNSNTSEFSQNINVVLGVSEYTPENVESGTFLQVFPNPFKSSVTIKFQIPDPTSQAILEIYNINGRLVRTIIVPRSYSRVRTVTWDGADDHGSPLSCGLYFIQLRGDKILRVKKVILY